MTAAPSLASRIGCAVLSTPIIGIVKYWGSEPMKVGRSPGAVSSRLIMMIPVAPAAWAAAPFSTNAQTPRLIATILPAEPAS